jgi:hypothetical protein
LVKKLKEIRITSKTGKKKKVDTIDEKIEKVNDMMQKAQESELDITKDGIKKLSSDTILSFEVEKYTSPEFSQKDKESLKKYLQENKNTSNHDFKNTLEKSANPTEIKSSIEKIYGKELNLLRI